MDKTYGEFEGTELDAGADFDFDDEQGDLLPILSLSALVALVVGGILVLLGRRRKPTPQERVEELLSDVGKQGKKGARKVAKAVEGADLAGMLSDAIERAQDAAGAVASKAGDAKLRDMLDDAIGRARDAADSLDVGGMAGDVGKRARKAAKGVDLATLLEDALDSVRQASDGLDVKGMARGARKRAGEAVESVRDADVGTKGFEGLVSTLKDSLSHLDEVLEKAKKASGQVDMGSVVSGVAHKAADVAASARSVDVDTKNIEGVLANLKEKLAEVVDAVRSDIAPKAMDTVTSDVLPAMQGAMGRVRDDVLPDAQGRVSKLVDDAEVGPRARRAAGAARSGAINAGDVLRTLAVTVLDRVMQDVLPGAKEMGGRAYKAAREDVIPAAAHTAGGVAHTVREDVLPRVGEAAAQTPGMLSDLLEAARDRAEDALDKAAPVASDAFTFGKHRAADATVFGKHRAADAADLSKRAAGGVASGVRATGSAAGGAASSVGRGVTGAVGGAAGATAYVTRETTGILFWLTMLGSLILLAFVPDKERQKEIFNGTLQFLGELREMWSDLQGVQFVLDGPDSDTTS
ncbi:MAG TPA: hypothetical protein VGE45_05835 [Chloroflexia bacterium]|jgi:ribosomal protein L12E/L44/L45/RPP1/RPP2